MSSTVSKWYWETDQGSWHLYSPLQCAELEDAFVNRVTKHPIDAERFVNTVKMEQRRFDMTGKVRAVKRTLPQTLKAHVVAVLGKTRFDCIKPITDAGGIATAYITPHVTLAICDDVASFSDDLTDAHALNIKVVASSSISKLIEAGSIAELVPQVYRPNVVANGFHPPIAPQEGPRRLGPGEFDYSVLDTTEPWKVHYLRPLDENTEWLGSLQYDDGTLHILYLDVHHFLSNGFFVGEIGFPVRKHSRYQVQGKLKQGGGPPTSGEKSHTLFFNIVKPIENADPKLAGQPFYGSLDPESKSITLRGFVGVISLDYTCHFPYQPLGFLQPGTTWSGKSLTEDTDFTMKVQPAPLGFGFTGEVESPTFGVRNIYGLGDHLLWTESNPNSAIPAVVGYKTCAGEVVKQLGDTQLTFKGTWTSTENGKPTAGTFNLAPMI